MPNKIALSIVSLLTVGLLALAIYFDPIAKVGAGYKAKILCSEVFVANRDPVKIATTEFIGIDPMFERISARVDQERKFVTASVFGLGKSRAVFREGYGCTLTSKTRLASLAKPLPVNNRPWPEAPPVSGRAIDRIDYAEIDYVLDQAIANELKNMSIVAGAGKTHLLEGILAGPAHRALLVAVDGKIVAERYADGFSKDTPFLSWSMAKSVTATLVGAAALKGYLDVNDPAPAAEWQGDPERSAITWNDLLRMQSGLAFEEIYEDPKSDANKMLFTSDDVGSAAANKPLIHPPGEHWSYSSGTTNLISRLLKETLEARGVNYHTFAQDALFGPIGAASITMEPDASGTFIGSSFVYATARDWARLGQLYLQDGVWNDERLLPEGWTEYVSTSTPASDGWYGAHFWLNQPGANDREKWIEGLPDDVYVMAGHEGQYVFIIPDKNIVIVRTGQTRGRPAMEVAGPVASALYRAVGAR